MLRRRAPQPHDPDAEDPSAEDPRAADPGAAEAVRDLPDLSSLSVAGLTRRRVAGLIGALIAVWIVIVFARQVGDASAAAARVDQMATDNAVLTREVAGLARELDQIQRQRYIEQQARAYRLGTSDEVAFTLADDAPPLPDDAPGSASVRLGSERSRVSPLDRWLTLLFGPGD